jgi:hypothetical protein
LPAWQMTIETSRIPTSTSDVCSSKPVCLDMNSQK